MKLFSKLPLVLALLFFVLALKQCHDYKPKKKVIKKKSLSIEEAAKHVVSFNIMMMDNNRYATGFYLKYLGRNYIVTNKHVCDKNKSIYKSNYIQFENRVEKIIAIDTRHDLCLVTSHRTDGLELSDEGIKPLDEVTVIGFPRGLGKTVRKGRMVEELIISASWLERIDTPCIMISALAYGGNSGSPILNTRGNVVGVLFAGSPSYHTETYIVPLRYLKAFLSETFFGIERPFHAR